MALPNEMSYFPQYCEQKLDSFITNDEFFSLIIYLFIYLFIPYLKKVTLLVKDYSTKRPSISHNKYIQYDNTKRDRVQTLN